MTVGATGSPQSAVIADFIAAMLSHTQGGCKRIEAAVEAARNLRGPGSYELRIATEGDRVIEDLERLADRWGSPALASAAVAMRTGGLRATLGPYLLERAQREAALPSAYQRTVADFVIVFLDMLTIGAEQEALVQAAAVLSGPGAEDLVEATTVDTTVSGAADRMTVLSKEWASPLLASLATVYGAGGPGPAAQTYLLEGAKAVASSTSWR